MKRLIYALAIVGASLAVACTGMAQGPGGPPGGMRGGPGGGNMMAMMRQREDAIFAQLHLTAGQKKKIEVFRNEREAKMKKMIAGMPKGSRPQRGMFKPIRDTYEKELSGVLSKEQNAKLDTLRKEARARFGGGRMGGPGGPGGRPGGPGGPGGSPPPRPGRA